MDMEDLISQLPKKFIHKDKYGLINLSAILSECSKDQIKAFADEFGLPSEEIKEKTRDEIIKDLIYLPLNPLKLPGVLHPLEYLGKKLLNFPPIKHMINNFDFISRKELIDAFADYCADLQINVFDVNEEKYGTMDLYLVKKIARLRTESVFVLKGSEVNEKYNQSLFQRMRDSEQVSDWRVFVTTPLGAIRIGYERLVKDMEEIGAWTYIIDPFHKRVLGATKGGKSKNMDKDLRDAFIEKLPSEPIRALSQVVKRSKYQWNEKEAYDPENIVPFYFVSKDGFKTEFEPTPPKYREIFRTLMIISKGSGLLMYKYNAGKDELDETLISGFLTAIDSFVNELSAGSGLNEIDYKNLKVIGTAGENVQLVAMLNDSPDKGFYERLEYLTQEFERDYADAIQTFIKKGLGSLDEDVIDNEVREILAV